MKVIPREAGRVTYSTEIRELKTQLFDEEQVAILVGNILGDGCLCENWSKTNFRMIISHSIDAKNYLQWKYKKLKKWILTKPRFYERNNSLTIRTISHPELTKLRNVFYEEKRKIVPKSIVDYLQNPLIIAVWFMDDGNAVIRNGKLCGYHINSQSFDWEENKLLAKALEDLHGIKSVIERNHNKPRLAIWRKDSRLKLRNLIKPYILEDMKYKLG
ncbi:MAG: hypothetical protein A3C06_02615 [Candidatus Taylorbacteria bacterium RIFCSPHIGHO2_02_FULL_46_13]|uniref:Homing endonuclease LAGLIDADG domain-containing protein n=1 Tax=Candidatus Taylorbacteria bacterium RIFCSPHIGHO2_02_FULL_46_13 TaxID=1802312 RepID=A0A1G2MRG7_9BACT|nr:MAG: hypothetical protein A3C06_02615 [Candidatus Taylorbacteria bacterium RIFCSPHIGHO2_02_FULL_46_13]